jgi:hypothetical protein
MCFSPCGFRRLASSSKAGVKPFCDQATLPSTTPLCRTRCSTALASTTCFRIPVADLALPPSVISEVTARRLSPDRPVADLAATYFGRLADDPSVGAGARAVGQPVLNWSAPLTTTQLPDPHLAREPLAETLQLRVMEYVRAHLAERDLTAAPAGRPCRGDRGLARPCRCGVHDADIRALAARGAGRGRAEFGASCDNP